MEKSCNPGISPSHLWRLASLGSSGVKLPGSHVPEHRSKKTEVKTARSVIQRTATWLFFSAAEWFLFKGMMTGCRFPKGGGVGRGTRQPFSSPLSLPSTAPWPELSGSFRNNTLLGGSRNSNRKMSKTYYKTVVQELGHGAGWRSIRCEG